MGSNGNEESTMVERSGWKGALAQSLKVAAVVMVLGYAVLAAEQRLVQDVSPDEIVAAEAAPAFVAASNSPAARTIAAQGGQVAPEPAQTASR
jgi:hypothetical protein